MYPRLKDYPKTLLLNGLTIKVRFRQRSKKVGGKNAHYELGYYSPSQRQIVISKDLRPAERLQVFIHESLHAIEDAYKLKVRHSLIHALDAPLAEAITGAFNLVKRKKKRKSK